VRGALVVRVGVVGLALLAAGCGSQALKVTEDAAPLTTVPAPTTTTSTIPVPVCPTPAVPAGTTITTLATPSTQNLAYSATPGGPAVGRVTEHWGGPSTRPVLAEEAGWVQIRLESRPDGSTGWLPASEVTLSTTPYTIVVSICNRSLTLFEGTTAAYSAPVGVGRPQWPTPMGPTFVDSIVATPRSQVYIYGPTVLILGTHSNVFTDFDGGDGTVAIHGYPSDPGSTDGVASSHGCVRSSPTTINTVKQVPVGTPVDIVT
jgi:L,D-transpeptidase catalytic domain